MKKPLGLLVAIAAVTQAPAFAQEAGWATFLADAIRGDLAEIEIGELAQRRSENDAVKEFGHTLVADHSQALARAQEIAEHLGVAPPSRPSAEAMATYRMLMELSGEEFDREFTRHAVMAHQNDIASYRSQAAGATNEQVAELAKSMLPALENHLATAQSLAGTVATSSAR